MGEEETINICNTFCRARQDQWEANLEKHRVIRNIGMKTFFYFLIQDIDEECGRHSIQNKVAQYIFKVN
jgi:hypothetical protein